MTRKVLLRYSTQKATEPILASVIKKTEILPNILYAELSTKGGEILLSIDAPDKEVCLLEGPSLRIHLNHLELSVQSSSTAIHASTAGHVFHSVRPARFT